MTRSLAGKLIGLAAAIVAVIAALIVLSAVHLLPQLRGAFSLIFCDERTLYAARYPHGVRPLVLGALQERGRADLHRGLIGSQDHARVEQFEQRCEVAALGGGQEGGDHLALPDPVGVGVRGSASTKSTVRGVL